MYHAKGKVLFRNIHDSVTVQRLDNSTEPGVYKNVTFQKNKWYVIQLKGSSRTQADIMMLIASRTTKGLQKLLYEPITLNNNKQVYAYQHTSNLPLAVLGLFFNGGSKGETFTITSLDIIASKDILNKLKYSGNIHKNSQPHRFVLTTIKEEVKEEVKTETVDIIKEIIDEIISTVVGEKKEKKISFPERYLHIPDPLPSKKKLSILFCGTNIKGKPPAFTIRSIASKQVLQTHNLVCMNKLEKISIDPIHEKAYACIDFQDVENTLDISLFFVVEQVTISSYQSVEHEELHQLAVSSTMERFELFAKSKYKLGNYKKPLHPAIFFGCYNVRDVAKILKHRGPALLVWGGSDIIQQKNSVIHQLRSASHVYHLAQSEHIMKDLKRMHFKRYIYLPWAPTAKVNNFNPVKKGKYIYIYTSAHNEDFYGKMWYERLIRDFPRLNFILATNPRSWKLAITQRKSFNPRLRAYPQNRMQGIYSKCFIGLRLVKHDGISATVQEMGLMGIPTITNGNTPACIKYKTYKDIINIIRREQKKVGTVDKELARKTKEHLALCETHLKTVFCPVKVNNMSFFLKFDGSYPKDFKWVTHPSNAQEAAQTICKKKTWVLYENPGTILYTNSSDSLTPPLEGWVRVEQS